MQMCSRYCLLVSDFQVGFTTEIIPRRSSRYCQGAGDFCKDIALIMFSKGSDVKMAMDEIVLTN